MRPAHAQISKTCCAPVTSRAINSLLTSADMHLFITILQKKKRKSTHGPCQASTWSCVEVRRSCGVSHLNVWVEECAGVCLFCSVSMAPDIIEKLPKNATRCDNMQCCCTGRYCLLATSEYWSLTDV